MACNCPPPCVVFSKGWHRFADANASSSYVSIRTPTNALSHSFPYSHSINVTGTTFWLRAGTDGLRSHSDVTRLAPWLLRLGRPFRLMSSDGDVGIVNRTDNAVLQRLLRSPLLLGWWAQNNLIDHPLMHPLPIGIDLHSGWDSTWPNTTLDRWRAYERVRDAAAPRGRRPVRLFMERFSIAHGSNYNERKDAWSRCAASAEVQGARMPKLQMLETYARAQFVLSPRGNGVDCHRTWDVLAVGAIPVVLRHGPAFDAVFDGQPVLLVRSWAEVCVGNATNASLLDGALRRFHSVGAQLDPRRWLGWCERRRSR